MSATPRTDALTKQWDSDGASRGPAYVELRDLARKLEIEIAEYREAAKRIIASEKERTKMVIALRDVRDDLLTTLRHIEGGALNLMCDRAGIAKAARDAIDKVPV